MNTTNQPDIIEYYRQPPLSSSTITNQGAFLLFILLLLCLPSHGQTPEAFCPERLWNFGVADNDEMLTHEFKIANNGNADLVIKSVRLSCRSCFSVELSEKEIPPGKSTILRVKLDLRGQPGQKHKTIFLDTNDSDRPVLIFRVEGEARAPACQETVAERTEVMARPRATWVVFITPDCDDCKWLQDEFIPQLRQKSPVVIPEILAVDATTSAGYELLQNVEKSMNAKAGDLPVLLAGNRLFHGREEITAAAREIVVSLVKNAQERIDRALNGEPEPDPFQWRQENRDIMLPLDQLKTESMPVPEPKEPQDDYQSADILIFATPGCQRCSRLEYHAGVLRKKYPELNIVTFDVAAYPERRILQMAMATVLSIPEKDRLATPMAVSGDAAIYGKFEDDALERLVTQCPPEPFWRSWDEARNLTSAKHSVTVISQNLSLLTLALAGLADGINPCAFAVIVFLLSCLSLSSGSSWRYSIVCGMLFCTGVFIFYYMTGLGFLRAADFLQRWAGMEKVLVRAGAGLCFMFGIGAFYDAYAARARGPDTMKFGMPKIFTNLSHRLMRNIRRPGFLLPAAVLIGFVVSGIEIVCTGQIYLPVLLLINQQRNAARPALLLLFYNLCFLLPMITIVFIGASSLGFKPLIAWGRKHAAPTRFLSGCAVVLLGIILLVMQG